MEMIVFISIICILGILLLLRMFFKVKVKHPFKLDKVIQKETDEYQNTIMYKVGRFADPVTASYISRYTVVNQGKQRSLIVQYNEPQKMIKYNVYVYSSATKLLEVLEVEERNSTDISRDIMLPRKAKKINIEVVSLNDESVNKGIKKVSFLKLFAYSLLSGTFVSMSLYGLIYLIISSTTASGNLLAIISFGIVYFVISLIRLTTKNGKDVDANGTK